MHNSIPNLVILMIVMGKMALYLMTSPWKQYKWVVMLLSPITRMNATGQDRHHMIVYLYQNLCSPQQKYYHNKSNCRNHRYVFWYLSDQSPMTELVAIIVLSIMFVLRIAFFQHSSNSIFFYYSCCSWHSLTHFWPNTDPAEV